MYLSSCGDVARRYDETHPYGPHCGSLNIKYLSKVWDSHVKDKTVGESVLSSICESLYWQDDIFILRRPPGCLPLMNELYTSIMSLLRARTDECARQCRDMETISALLARFSRRRIDYIFVVTTTSHWTSLEWIWDAGTWDGVTFMWHEYDITVMFDGAGCSVTWYFSVISNELSYKFIFRWYFIRNFK